VTRNHSKSSRSGSNKANMPNKGSQKGMIHKRIVIEIGAW
jgi:hypothetical protein